MASPNIVSVSTILGKTAVQIVATAPTAIVTNDVNSFKVYKINALYISNVNGTSPADVTIDLFRNSVAYRIGNTITVPADTTLDLLSKSIYLEEGDALRLTSSLSSYIEAVCSYEEIS
jgi:hypothetical protein